LSWAFVAWQTGTKEKNNEASANDRLVQRERERAMPWVSMDSVMQRMHNSESFSKSQRPIVEIRSSAWNDEARQTEARIVAAEPARGADEPECGGDEPECGGETAGDDTTSEPEDTAATSTPPSPAAAEPTETDEHLTPQMIALRDKLRRALEVNFPRHQNTRDNTAWEVMHAIIAYGVDTQLYRNSPGGERVNAVGWLCFNYPCQGDQMLFVNRGKIEARRGVGVQGHHGQFLAILAQSHVKGDYPMYVSGKQFTLQDLIEFEKANCYAGEELTFKLIGLMHYLDSDETWSSKDGQEWSIQRLVQEELKQPIRGAACGGTHRLMGFSYAVNKRIQRGKPIVGEFARAQKFIQDYHRYTISLQNPDGSFSTEWFVRRGNSPDIDRRLKTSGHILEWMAFSVSDEELRDPRMVKAADYLATLLIANDGHKWEIGPLGHGLHALAIYNSRVFKGNDFTKPLDLVMGPPEVPTPLQAKRPRHAK
jgi:hypothetical protein